jgi:eukaryotic-like serine/threonine-protein kinase
VRGTAQPQRFGPFVIVRTLGRGGMGEVFVARTPWPRDPVAAVKRLRPDVARLPTFVERFKHEAALAVRLSHPRIVRTLDVASVGDQMYVASELIFGKDAGYIADRLRQRGRWGPAEVAIRLLLDGLEGLAYVHRAEDQDGSPLNLVHRDITPGNVLLGYDGSVRLADFGLAKSSLNRDLNLTHVGEVLGTPNYVAPEVVDGAPATPASDLYGLGAVIYRFLAGVPPHQGNPTDVLTSVLRNEPAPLSEIRPDLDPWLADRIHRLLDKDPQQRPARAAEVHRDLRTLAVDAGLLVPRTSIGQWLAQLFELEQQQEAAERERLVDLPDPEFSSDGPGTVVLARPRPGGGLQAPGAVELRETEPPVDATEGRSVPEPALDPASGASGGSPPSAVAPDGFDEQMPTQAVRLDVLGADDAERTDRSHAPIPQPTRIPPTRESTPAESNPSLPGFVGGPARSGEDPAPPPATPHTELARTLQSGAGRTALAVAALVGVALGYAVSVVVEARTTAVEVELLRTRKRLVESEASGELPKGAWRTWSEAAEKALVGDVSGARETLEGLSEEPR